MLRSARIVAPALFVLAAIQLVRLPRTNPPGRGDLPAPAEIRGAIRRACFDCHSNETRWPWYTAIAPISWLAYRDVSEGRRRLNISYWSDYADDPGTASRKLDQIAKSIESGSMPPWYFRAIHPEARLSRAERDAIARWALTEAHRLPASR